MSFRGVGIFLIKLISASGLALALFFALVILATTTGASECSSDCSVLGDMFNGNGAWFVLGGCFVVAVGIVWALPAALRRHRSNRHVHVSS